VLFGFFPLSFAMAISTTVSLSTLAALSAFGLALRLLV